MAFGRVLLVVAVAYLSADEVAPSVTASLAPDCTTPQYVSVTKPDRVFDVWASRDKYRLVVGAGKYSKDPAANRPFIAATAKAVDEELARSGFAKSLGLLLDEQATKQAMIDAFSQLIALPPEAVVVIYYIGHGIPVNDGEDLRLAVADERVTDFNGLPIRELLRKALGRADLRFRKLPRLIFVLESCYAGAGAQFFVDRFAAGLDTSKRLVFLSATSPSEQARPLSGAKRFAFGAFLVRALTVDWACADILADGALTVLELRTYLQRQLRAAEEAKDMDGAMTPSLVDFGLYSIIQYRPDKVADLHGFRDAIVELYADALPGTDITFRTVEGMEVQRCNTRCSVLTDSPESINAVFAQPGFSVSIIAGSDVRDRLAVPIMGSDGRATKSQIGTIMIRK